MAMLAAWDGRYRARSCETDVLHEWVFRATGR